MAFEHFISAQIQFEYFLRLPSCFGEVLQGKRTPCVCMSLHLPSLAHLFATKARANICVSMGPAGWEYLAPISSTLHAALPFRHTQSEAKKRGPFGAFGCAGTSCQVQVKKLGHGFRAGLGRVWLFGFGCSGLV